MTAPRIVPAFDEIEHRETRLDRRAEPVPIKELALERREEAPALPGARGSRAAAGAARPAPPSSARPGDARHRDQLAEPSFESPAALRMFGSVLKTTTECPIQPGRALDLLPPAPLPDDMYWAEPNPRIAAAVSRWAGVVERESAGVVKPHIRNLVHDNLLCWMGEPMPISRSWVEKEVEGLTGPDRAIARFALVLAKAPYQVDEALVGQILREDRAETRFIRILAWASFSAARRIAKRVADTVHGPFARQNEVSKISLTV